MVEEHQYCSIHHDVETNITCSNCGKPICPKCMIYAPVGVKCPDCGRMRGRAAGGTRPIYYVRAGAAGLAAGVFGGLIMGELVRVLPFGGIILAFVLGVGIGEIISKAARRNTGPIFQIIAGLSAALAFLVAGYLTGIPVLSINGYHGLLFAGINPVRLMLAGIGIYMATMRLKD